MNLGNDYQWLLISQRRDSARYSVPLDGNTHNIYEILLKKKILLPKKINLESDQGSRSTSLQEV